MIIKSNKKPLFHTEIRRDYFQKKGRKLNEQNNNLDTLLADLRAVQNKIEFTEQKIKEIETPPYIGCGEKEEFLYALGTAIDKRLSPQDLFNRDIDKLKQFALYLLAACNCGEEYEELKKHFEQSEKTRDRYQRKLTYQIINKMR